MDPQLVSAGKGAVVPRVPFYRRIGQFLVNWASEMLLLILTVASILGAAMLVYFLTGRAPQENMDWLMGYSSQSVLIALAITFTSAARQAWGIWLTESQLLDRPLMALIQAASSLSVFFACLYVLLH